MKRQVPLVSLLVLLILAAGLALAVAPAATAPLVLDWRVIGTGRTDGTCAGGLSPGCTSTAEGDAIGTHTGNSTWSVKVMAGTSPSRNSSLGSCLPADGQGVVAAANGDLVSFSTVGWVCEENRPGSPYHYNGTYRINSGTGQFADAAGGGNLASTHNNNSRPSESFIKIDGTINF